MIYRDPMDLRLLQAEADEGGPLLSLLSARATDPRSASLPSIAVGRLVAISGSGAVPLVTYPGQSGMAARACRSVVDLHGAHIGRSVVLVFEDGDAAKPIVMGVLRAEGDRPPELSSGSATIDADGERMIVSAKEQLVLRCGKASITLTRSGKVTIDGTFVSSRSSGANRIKGGSVQIN